MKGAKFEMPKRKPDFSLIVAGNLLIGKTKRGKDHRPYKETGRKIACKLKSTNTEGNERNFSHSRVLKTENLGRNHLHKFQFGRKCYNPKTPN